MVGHFLYVVQLLKRRSYQDLVRNYRVLELLFNLVKQLLPFKN